MRVTETFCFPTVLSDLEPTGISRVARGWIAVWLTVAGQAAGSCSGRTSVVKGQVQADVTGNTPEFLQSRINDLPGSLA